MVDLFPVPLQVLVAHRILILIWFLLLSSAAIIEISLHLPFRPTIT